MNNTAAITPSKLVKGLADYVGKGNVLGFNGTLKGDTLTFKPDTSSYTLKNDYDYEIDLLFQAAGALPDTTKVVIKNGIDTINIVNVNHSDYTQPATYGNLKQVCRYDKNIGWRWIFNVRYKSVDSVKAFIMPSTVVNVAGLATEEDLTALNNTIQAEIQPKIDNLSTKINNVSSSLTNSINNKIIVVSAVPDPAIASTLYCIPE